MPSAKTKQNPANETPAGVGGQGWLLRPPTEVSTLHLLLRGQGVREVRGVQGVREVQVVQGCRLGQGGRRVPAAGEGRPGERRPGATPTSLPRQPREGALTLGPRGPVSPLGPYGVAGEETKGTGLEENREESWGAGCGEDRRQRGRGLPRLHWFLGPWVILGGWGET